MLATVNKIPLLCTLCTLCTIIGLFYCKICILTPNLAHFGSVWPLYANILTLWPQFYITPLTIWSHFFFYRLYRCLSDLFISKRLMRSFGVLLGESRYLINYSSIVNYIYIYLNTWLRDTNFIRNVKTRRVIFVDIFIHKRIFNNTLLPSSVVGLHELYFLKKFTIFFTDFKTISTIYIIYKFIITNYHI